MPATPRRLRATIMNPDTAPPRRETAMASLRLRVAAEAVRTLARTATYIPMKPERAEQKAPMRKAMAVRTPISTSSSK
ncbi:hypothetical protein HRbin25_00920 [bacterium HR25]|nr:hypothetical protein HRbin25_00920 [bacterium HR25]